MELVEGQTVADRIAATSSRAVIPAQAEIRRSTSVGLRSPRSRGQTSGADNRSGRAIPIDEALPIAKQICEGLEYAHERGIVHRDLKPANVKITPDGLVKILDFGLAKALEGETPAGDISSSPTLTYMATQAGIILGTAAYMSPEQAKGRSVDRRADIWALGAVLYEMLAGKQAFQGEDLTETLFEVVRGEPDWAALPQGTPASIQKLIRRCLAKDPRQRLQAIGEARIAIDEAMSGTDGSPVVEHGPQALALTGAKPAPVGSPLQHALPWAIATAASAAFVITLAMLWPRTRTTTPAPAELNFEIPSTRQLYTPSGPAAVISPDGSRIAYVAGAEGQEQIYVRDLDKSQATRLEGAEGRTPFFSPDGRWIGFFGNNRKLQKVSVFGGAPITICDATGGRGASWGEDGTIVFTPGVTAPLERVSAAGGTPQPVTHLDARRNEATHRWPQVLPGGKDAIFTASAYNNSFVHGDIEVASLSTSQAKVLVENAYFGRYLASGYLAYVSSGTLFAVPFDAKNLKITGTAMPVIPDISADDTNGSAQFSVSTTGTAIYVRGKTLGAQLTVELADRQGAATPLVKQPGDYYAPRFSPDGKQLALQVGVGNTWIYDIAHETLTPLTFLPANCFLPVWTPDGKRIACYEANPAAGGLNISWIPSNGTGRLQSLTKATKTPQAPASWSPDGKTLAYFGFRATGSCCEIWTVTLGPDGQPEEPKALLGQNSGGAFEFPSFSPDGHWLAYQSDESGTEQIYVVPYPGPGGKRQASVSGGTFPRWSKTGHELFYAQTTNVESIVSFPYSVRGDSFEPGTPRVLFTVGFPARGTAPSYDVTPDGQHFAVLVPSGGQSAQLLSPTVVMNWLARAKKLVAAGQK